MNSSNGFQTNVWGAPMWLCLHVISLNYRPEMRSGYRAFFESLRYVLPCGACRDNYARILRETLPLSDEALSCRRSMAMWVFLLHNQVQRDIFEKTHLESNRPKFEDTVSDFNRAMSFYEKFRARCVRDQYGCVKPLKGSRRRSRIDIVKFSKPRSRNAIVDRS